MDFGELRNKLTAYIHGRWWEPAIGYVILWVLLYLGIWAGIEPLGIPDTLRASDIPLSRGWWHIVATTVFAAHSLIAAWLWVRRTKRHQPSVANRTDPSDHARQVEEMASEVETLTRELSERRETLAKYESLEQEILGLLSPGIEVELNNLPGLLDLHSVQGSLRQVGLAVANLQGAGKIEGTGRKLRASHGHDKRGQPN